MWGFFNFFFPLFCLIKGQGKAKVCFLFQASWQCCGAEEEAEEELPASFTGLEGQLGSLAGNVSRLWEGARLPPSPPGWTLPCVLVSGEELCCEQGCVTDLVLAGYRERGGRSSLPLLA